MPYPVLFVLGFHSLTTNRPYRKALSAGKALEIIWSETRRGWWDVELVDALQGMLQESPMAFSVMRGR
jgi:HD-GYP domain-containing protein (c-di-GMP phosphodiesterase class II)